MGKTRDLFKKIRDTKGTFHAKMGTVKDRNGMDLIEAEDIKKRWQEQTEELYKKDLHDPVNHDGERVTGRKARGSPNGGKRLQVPDIFIYLKWQEENKPAIFFLLYTNLKGFS